MTYIDDDELAAHLADDGLVVAPQDICDGCGVTCEPLQCACGECLCDDCMEDHWLIGHMG